MLPLFISRVDIWDLLQGDFPLLHPWTPASQDNFGSLGGIGGSFPPFSSTSNSARFGGTDVLVVLSLPSLGRFGGSYSASAGGGAPYLSLFIGGVGRESLSAPFVGSSSGGLPVTPFGFPGGLNLNLPPILFILGVACAHPLSLRLVWLTMLLLPISVTLGPLLLQSPYRHHLCLAPYQPAESLGSPCSKMYLLPSIPCSSEQTPHTSVHSPEWTSTPE